LSKEIDFKALEKKLWQQGSSDGPDSRFSSGELSPASVGLASIRMKRWTRLLIASSCALIVLSCLTWLSKTHHVLKLSTQDGYVRAVELFVKDE